MFAARRQFDGCGAAKGRWIVVLGAGWNVDDNGFGVAANVNPILFALACSRVAVQRSANGNSHSTGTTDASASGSFGIGHQGEAALRTEEFGDFGEKREPITLGFDKRGEGGKTFLPLNIARHEADGFVAVGFNAARSVKRNGGVESDRARMKQVERPDIERAAGKVHTCWRLRFDDHRSDLDGWIFGRGSLTEGAGKLKKGKRKCQQKGNGSCGTKKQECGKARSCALNYEPKLRA